MLDPQCAVCLLTVLTAQYARNVLCCIPQDGNVLCSASFSLRELRYEDAQFMLKIV